MPTSTRPASRPARRGPSPRPAARPVPLRPRRAETETELLERHARYVAADPVLVRYHADREATVLEQAAARLDNPKAASDLLAMAATHRQGGRP